jgi:SSS family solute:Na+ symporter
MLPILFFALYIAVVVIIGIISSRKETEDGFMIADRNVKGFQLAATMSAGFFDGAILGFYFAYLYQYGASAIWLFLGGFIGLYIFRKYAPRIKEKADQLQVYTMAEYFFRLFGRRNGIMFTIFLVIQFFMLLVVNLIVSGKVLSSIFPLSYTVSVLIGGAIVLSYLLLAGLKAVIKTDIFQLLIMLIMSIGVGGFLITRTHIPTADLNLFQLGWGNIIGLVILAVVTAAVAPDLWQRIMASRDSREAKKGIGYAAFILVILGVTVGIMGLATKQFFPDIRPEDALVTGFKNLLPFGLSALGMVLLYAVSLSSSDTITFVLSSIFTRDFKNYTARYSEQSMKRMTRFFMVILILLAVTLAASYQGIVQIALSLGSLNAALFPVVLGSFYWTLKERAVYWSLLLALISVLILFFAKQLTPETAILSLPVSLVSLLVLQKILK